MRIHIKTTGSIKTLPFNYQNLLTGTLHKWMGKNDLHDGVSYYSFSWLKGGEAMKNGLRFVEGADFFISAIEETLIKKIIDGIRQDPEMFYGLKATEIIIQQNPVFPEERIFHPASPILIKRKEENNEKHFTYEDEASNQYLTETLKTKLRKAGLDDSGVHVEFDPDYRNRKIKTIYYNKIGNKVSMSAVKITGTPEQLAFAWNVGVGNSTGIGFGALK